MKKYFLLTLSLCFVGLTTFAQTFSVSANNRYILKNNKPFVWVGDTAWELFHALDRESATFYLSKRASQGFTVIQAVALAELDGLNSPNAYGQKPLIDNDPTRPNEGYFKHVDFIIDKAAELGLTIAFLPTWGDKLSKLNWGKGPEIFSPENAKTYGKWLGNRYKNRENIIWLLGGDRNPRENTNDVQVWQAMAVGIAEACGGNANALMSFHPQPNAEGASQWFHQDQWFDFNMFQTGHCRNSEVYNSIKGSYDRLPTKPTIDGEPIYEDHPVCFNPRELGISNAHDVRRSIYLTVFAGAFGFTYGCHDVWQMYAPNRESVNGAKIFWHQALDLTAANQVRFLRKLIEARPILERVPDQSLIVENNAVPAERIQATRGNDYAFVYTTAGNRFTVNLGKISGTELTCSWYNPRNGEVKEAGKTENKGTKVFTPPTSGYGQDWVLIIDDAAKKYEKP